MPFEAESSSDRLLKNKRLFAVDIVVKRCAITKIVSPFTSFPIFSIAS
jgi:hypothetical protein